MINELARAKFRPVRTRLGYLLLVVTAIGWAGAWITARRAAHALPPTTVTWGRFAVASVALLPAWWLLERRAGIKVGIRDAATVAGMSLTGIVGYTVLFMMGVARAPAADGAVIVPGLAGPFALALGWLLVREAPPRRILAASGLSVAGCALVGAAGASASLTSARVAGDLLFVGGAALWGAYTVLGRRLADRVPAVTAVLLASVIGTAMLSPIVLAPGRFPRISEWSVPARWNVLYLGVVATAVSFVTYYLGVRFVGLHRAAPSLGLVPVLGVLGAVVFLGERPGPLALAGGVLVVAGIVLSAAARQRPR